MKQALEALTRIWEDGLENFPESGHDAAITALRTAIEAADKQEPVALEAVYETIIHWDEGGGKRSRRELARRIVDLYTTPPAAQPCSYIRSTAEGTHHCALSQRQPLTDEGIDAGVAAWFSTETVVGGRPFEKRMRAAIEAAHGIKEKNT